MAQLHVELVAADRKVWSGDASMIIAKTVDGDIGILPGHAPVLCTLLNGTVQIHAVGADADGGDRGNGELVAAAVHGGFLSVAENNVSILAELAELATEIDIERARADVERVRAMMDADEDALAQAQRAENRIRTHGLAF